MPEPIIVVGLGANTPIGRDAWSSAAAVRAGISGFGEHPHMIDSAGQPMRVARAEWLDIGLSGVDRFEALLIPAIDQAIEPLNAQTEQPGRVAIALGLPSQRPGLPEFLQRDLMSRVNSRYSRLLGATAVFPAGHAAGLLALDAAVKKLQQGGLDACVVAGVDTYIEPETLEWLESCDQLHSAGPLNNAWGFIPGEAAGALLLVRGETAKRMVLAPLAAILATGSAHEPKRIKTETICIGEGLTQAFRATLAALPDGVQVSDVYCDMNGEPYRADEYGFTCLRTKESFISASDFVAPADCWGDVAAAGGMLHLMLATIAGLKGYAYGQITFVWASSEGGERAAALIAARGGV
jgi:3-oxoacyl-[acyl-carrier-protein] synthase-1